MYEIVKSEMNQVELRRMTTINTKTEEPPIQYCWITPIQVGKNDGKTAIQGQKTWILSKQSSTLNFKHMFFYRRLEKISYLFSSFNQFRLTTFPTTQRLLRNLVFGGIVIPLRSFNYQLLKITRTIWPTIDPPSASFRTECECCVLHDKIMCPFCVIVIFQTHLFFVFFKASLLFSFIISLFFADVKWSYWSLLLYYLSPDIPMRLTALQVHSLTVESVFNVGRAIREFLPVSFSRNLHIPLYLDVPETLKHRYRVPPEHITRLLGNHLKYFAWFEIAFCFVLLLLLLFAILLLLE